MVTRLTVALLALFQAPAAEALHALEPLDTSSPRATLQSFLALTEQVARDYIEYRDSPGPATQRALSQSFGKMGRVLDLSQVPPAAREEVAGESVLFLWEVIARLELPELEEIPDALAVKGDDKEGEELTSWRIPGTEISIARLTEGRRAGEFLFSPDTVERVESFYELVRELPYLRPVPGGDLSRTAQIYTGWMIPLAWVEALPEWANASAYGMVLWKWLAMLLLLGLALMAVGGIFRWGQRGSWDGSLRSYLRRLSTPVAILVFASVLQFLGDD